MRQFLARKRNLDFSMCRRESNIRHPGLASEPESGSLLFFALTQICTAGGEKSTLGDRSAWTGAFPWRGNQLSKLGLNERLDLFGGHLIGDVLTRSDSSGCLDNGIDEIAAYSLDRAQICAITNSGTVTLTSFPQAVLIRFCDADLAMDALGRNP